VTACFGDDNALLSERPRQPRARLAQLAPDPIRCPEQTAWLPRAELRLSRLGFGTAPLASVYWGNDEAVARDAVRRALDRGFRFFDTAPFYGLGECETRLGAALREHSGSGSVTIATKVGRLLEPAGDGGLDARFDFGYGAALRSIETSLDRLGVDRVHICHIHDPDDHITEALDGAHRALTELRSQGVIDAVSVGTNTVATAEAFLERGDIDCLLVAGRYTLLDQSAAALIDRCAARGVAFLAAGVFNSGVLADAADGAWYDYAPAAPAVLHRARDAEAVCARHGVTLRHAALAFPAVRAGVTAVVVGMAAPKEVDDNLRALSSPIPDGLWNELADEGLIDPRRAACSGPDSTRGLPR